MRNLALPIALTTSIVLNAQQPAFKAAHGGQLVRAGSHSIEMVLRGDEALFYVLDSTGTTVPPEGITGTAYVKYDDGTTANLAMEPSKDGYFRVVLMNASSFMVMASFKVNGAFASAPFHSGARSAVPAVQPHSTGDGHQH